MAYTNFDLQQPVGGGEQFSDPVALASGEIAQVRFTSFNAIQAFFEVTRNSTTTRETITDKSSDICSIVGPASVRLGAEFSGSDPRAMMAANYRVVGILEGQ